MAENKTKKHSHVREHHVLVVSSDMIAEAVEEDHHFVDTTELSGNDCHPVALASLIPQINEATLNLDVIGKLLLYPACKNQKWDGGECEGEAENACSAHKCVLARYSSHWTRWRVRALLRA